MANVINGTPENDKLVGAISDDLIRGFEETDKLRGGEERNRNVADRKRYSDSL